MIYVRGLKQAYPRQTFTPFAQKPETINLLPLVSSAYCAEWWRVASGELLLPTRVDFCGDQAQTSGPAPSLESSLELVYTHASNPARRMYYVMFRLRITLYRHIAFEGEARGQRQTAPPHHL